MWRLSLTLTPVGLRRHRFRLWRDGRKLDRRRRGPGWRWRWSEMRRRRCGWGGRWPWNWRSGRCGRSVLGCGSRGRWVSFLFADDNEWRRAVDDFSRWHTRSFAHTLQRTLWPCTINSRDNRQSLGPHSPGGTSPFHPLTFPRAEMEQEEDATRQERLSTWRPPSPLSLKW
jgi:hypothetical protein